jgi:hypothetical protein
MTLHGGRPYIDVLLGGHAATLLVDTSAVTTLLDPNVLDQHGLGLSLQINELRFPHLNAQVAGVRSYTATNLGTPADGIIGADLLSRYPVQFDFPDRQLTIFRTSAAASVALPKTATAAALRVIDGKPALAAALDSDTGLWFSLATGSPFQMQIEPDVEGASRLSRQSLPLDDVTVAGTLNGRLARAHALTLGGVIFYQPLVAIVDAQRPGSELAGSLGARLLSRLDMLIDESASDAKFVAGPGATAAQLYDPSGLLLVMHRGSITIRNVVPFSPADIARLRPGDEIISINGLAPATLDFAKDLLSASPGSKVTVVYRRWHLAHAATLTMRVLI